MFILYFLTLFLLSNEVAPEANKTNALGLSGAAADLRLICNNCIYTDFLPLYAKHLFNGLNVTEVEGYSNWTKKCDTSTAKQCEPGEICAKKKNLFVAPYQGNNYEFENAAYMCVSKNMHGTNEFPLSGQCYEEKSARKNVSGVQVSATWCYCRNEDYCNSDEGISMWLGLILAPTTLLIFH